MKNENESLGESRGVDEGVLLGSLGDLDLNGSSLFVSTSLNTIDVSDTADPDEEDDNDDSDEDDDSEDEDDDTDEDEDDDAEDDKDDDD
jgi:hypothetical protein